VCEHPKSVLSNRQATNGWYSKASNHTMLHPLSWIFMIVAGNEGGIGDFQVREQHQHGQSRGLDQ
jgi:hypothetical protein